MIVPAVIFVVRKVMLRFVDFVEKNLEVVEINPPAHAAKMKAPAKVIVDITNSTEENVIEIEIEIEGDHSRRAPREIMILIHLKMKATT